MRDGRTNRAATPIGTGWNRRALAGALAAAAAAWGTARPAGAGGGRRRRVARCKRAVRRSYCPTNAAPGFVEQCIASASACCEQHPRLGSDGWNLCAGG